MNPVKGRLRPGLTAAIVIIHLVAIYGIWWCMTWGVTASAWILAAVLYAVSSLGVTVGYHRYFTHGSFHCRKSVKYALAVAGGLAAEGPLAQWCPDHRQHHRFTETGYDPHSPWQHEHYPFPLNRIVGFLWAHLWWLFYVTVRPTGYNPAAPVHDAHVIAWQQKYYWHIVLAGFIIPFLVAGWSGLFLAGFIRVVAHLHATWMVNSVCHLWGTRPIGPDGEIWKKDQSRNNLLVAVLTMGEGWHGNHHVRQNSAQLGYRWYHWDPGKWVIHTLALFRLARDVQPFVRA